MSDISPSSNRRMFSFKSETMASLFFASIFTAGVIALSLYIVVWDVSSFKGKIEKLFSVSLDPKTEVMLDTEYVKDSISRISASVINGRVRSFDSLTDIPEEAPRPLDIKAAPPRPARNTNSSKPMPSLPVADESIENLEKHIDRSDVSHSVVSVRRKADIKVPGRKLKLKPISLESLSDGLGMPGQSLKPAEPGPSPIPASENIRFSGPVVSNFERIDDAGPITKMLVDSRPENGHPSLDDEIEAEFDVYREQGAVDSFFRLKLRLKSASKVPNVPKDVLFLIDISQSISYKELDLVRAAVVSHLSALPKDDRWNVNLFGVDSISMNRFFVSSKSFNAEAVGKFIRKRSGQRRTDVLRATRRILQQLPHGKRPCNVFLISDGKATQGTSDVHDIVHKFRRADRERFSIFSYNVGKGGNPYLLSLLSYRSRGFYGSVEAMDVAKGRISEFFSTYNRPVLTHTVASYSNIHRDMVFPEVLPNLYRDAPITFWGKTTQGQNLTLRIAGIGVNGKPSEFYFRVSVPKGDASNPQIASQWARGKAHSLIARIADSPKDKSLHRELVLLARKYNLEDIIEIARRNRWR